MKMRFIGETDENFTNGIIYEIVEVGYRKGNYFNTLIINDYDNVKYIPYPSINTFLENWEVVDE